MASTTSAPVAQPAQATDCLYNGHALGLFLADRLAVGFSTEVIRADFENMFGHSISEAELDEFRASNAGLIQERYDLLVRKIEEESLFGRVLRITRKIENLVEGQFDINNSRQLASLLSVLRNYQEMLISKSKELKSNNSPAPSLDFASLFDELEGEGIIEVKDRKRLENILDPATGPQSAQNEPKTPKLIKVSSKPVQRVPKPLEPQQGVTFIKQPKIRKIKKKPAQTEETAVEEKLLNPPVEA